MNLEEKFKKETGFDALKMYQIKEIGFSVDYVEWLEAKINYKHCCAQLKDK